MEMIPIYGSRYFALINYLFSCINRASNYSERYTSFQNNVIYFPQNVRNLLVKL